MKKFLLTSVFSFFSIVFFINALYIPSYGIFPLLNIEYDKLGWYGPLGFIILPPIIGTFIFIFFARRFKVPYRHPIFFFPYYLALYVVTIFMSGSIVIKILNVESVRSDNIGASILYFVVQYLLITSMVYVFTPKSIHA